ncbi:hypothetical protein [Haloarchaeobius sp. TZWSO28]|uniref:hypothetical protein n=1 Tax=Haloarchaeobius sp. TZWSO28 TaxID=3446119 RepID=UPI003EB9655B
MDDGLVSSEDWQAKIDGIGVFEFVEIEEQEAFIEKINEYIDGTRFFDFHPADSHAIVAESRVNLTKEVSIPDEYCTIFDKVEISPVNDTNKFVRLFIYATVDTDSFKRKREEEYLESGQQLQLENAGLRVLKQAEEGLSTFFQEEVQSGFVTEQLEEWTSRNQISTNHPSLWVYNLSPTDIDSVDELREKRKQKHLYIGLGDEYNSETQLTEFADGRSIVAGDGGCYFQSELGSFPFRYLSVQFEPELVREKIWDEDSDVRERSSDYKQVVRPISQSYLHLFWSLHSYYQLSDYDPDAYFEDDEEGRIDIESMSDSSKAQVLDELFNGNREMDDDWIERQQQFESIRTIQQALGGIHTREESPVQPILSSAVEIESLCEDKVNRYNRRYEQATDRLHTNLETSVGIVGKEISVVIFFLSIASLVLQYSSISPTFGPTPAGLVAILILIFVMFYLQYRGFRQ